MKNNPLLRLVAACALLFLLTIGCNTPVNEEAIKALASKVKTEADIKMYTQVWDDIINKNKMDLFNETNFTKGVIFHASPQNIVGIDSARAYYANYTTGFSNVVFTIKDVFGQGDKIVKHWVFKGVHTGVFFGIPATGKTVNLEGATIVRMDNGKIAEEQDFFDNLEFMQQLGLIPR